MSGPIRPVPFNLEDTYFEVYLSVHSLCIKYILIIPIKSKLFLTYIYCISPTCFGVTFTFIRENFSDLYLKPCVVTRLLSVVSIVVVW